MANWRAGAAADKQITSDKRHTRLDNNERKKRTFWSIKRDEVFFTLPLTANTTATDDKLETITGACSGAQQQELTELTLLID